MKKKAAAHATLADVARLARVGTSTVSRVINGGERVSSRTLARVHEVIRQLNYHPNQAARILRGERTRLIGLLVPSIADSFFARCAEAAQDVCRSHNFLLTVACSNNDAQIELENVNILLQRRIDGLLLAPAISNNPALIGALNRVSIPTVAIDRPIQECAVPVVLSDNYRGAKEATRHLIAHGYKRILLLGMQYDQSLHTNQERIRGYRHAMRAAGLTPTIDTSLTSYESAERILKTHLNGPSRPDAIFAIRNLVTIYSVEIFRKLQVKAPVHVAFLGFDDFELSGTLDPPVTVIRQQDALMGKVAAETLFEQVMLKRQHRLKAAGQPVIRKLPTELIVRASCGCVQAPISMPPDQQA